MAKVEAKQAVVNEIKEKLVKNTKKKTEKAENVKSVEKTDEQKETA